MRHSASNTSEMKLVYNASFWSMQVTNSMVGLAYDLDNQYTTNVGQLLYKFEGSMISMYVNQWSEKSNNNKTWVGIGK